LLPRLVGRMRDSFAWIEPKDLKRRLDGGEAVTVVDVRGPDEFIGSFGHIATARNIPVAELDGRLAELAGLERAPLVLVCRTGQALGNGGANLACRRLYAGHRPAPRDGAMERCRPAGRRPRRRGNGVGGLILVF
jgi:hypothetical protein